MNMQYMYSKLKIIEHTVDNKKKYLHKNRQYMYSKCQIIEHTVDNKHEVFTKEYVVYKIIVRYTLYHTYKIYMFIFTLYIYVAQLKNKQTIIYLK